jgi:hypothetical protein
MINKQHNNNNFRRRYNRIIFMLLSLNFGGFTPSTGSLGRNKWLRIDEASRSAAAARHFGVTAGARCGHGSQVLGKLRDL